MSSNKSTTAFSYLPLETRFYINMVAESLIEVRNKSIKYCVYLEPTNELPTVSIAYQYQHDKTLHWCCDIFDYNDWSEATVNEKINLPILLDRYFMMVKNTNYDSEEIVVFVRTAFANDEPMFRLYKLPETPRYHRPGGYVLTNDTKKELLTVTEFDQEQYSSFLNRIKFSPIGHFTGNYFPRLHEFSFVRSQAFNDWLQENRNTSGIASESLEAVYKKIDSCFENESNVYIEFFRSYQIHFAIHPQLLTEFFNSSTKKILDINTESSFLTILRIIDLFSKEEIFLVSKDTFNFTEYLTYWLNSHYNLLVIEDTLLSETVLRDMSSILTSDSLKLFNSNKKVILVNKSQQISKNIHQTIDNFDDKGWFNDFSEDVQNDLVSREVVLQGVPLKLGDALDKNTISKILDKFTLDRLTQGWSMKIGEHFNKFNKIRYFQRTLRRQLVNREVLNSEFLSNNLVLISNITAEELSHLEVDAVQHSESKNLRNGICLLNNPEENLNNFHKRCHDSTVNGIFWLEHKESRLFLKDFSGNVTSFVENLEDLPFSEEISVNQFVPNNKVNIITDFPGMGGETFLNYLAGELKECNPTHWVFSNIFFEKDKNKMDNLSQKFFNAFDYSQLIIVCNFEEIVDLETQDVVFKQIQYLASRNSTVWIICNLESRVKLQILFQTAAYRINPLKVPETSEYFSQTLFWHNLTGVRNLRSTHKETYYFIMRTYNIPDEHSKIEFTGFPYHWDILHPSPYLLDGGLYLSVGTWVFHTVNNFKRKNKLNEQESDELQTTLLNLLKKITANEYNLIKPKLPYSSFDEIVFKVGLMFVEKEKLVFVHSLYKFFFLAQYIQENSIEKEFMVKVLREDEYLLVRKMLNNMTKHPDDKCLIYNNIIQDIHEPWSVIANLCNEGNKNLAKFLTDDFYRFKRC